MFKSCARILLPLILSYRTCSFYLLLLLLLLLPPSSPPAMRMCSNSAHAHARMMQGMAYCRQWKQYIIMYRVLLMGPTKRPGVCVCVCVRVCVRACACGRFVKSVMQWRYTLDGRVHTPVSLCVWQDMRGESHTLLPGEPSPASAVLRPVRS